jgi:hypothetical protein
MTEKIYLKGKIKEELRGNLALIITRLKGSTSTKDYDNFLLHPIKNSESFIQVTGLRSVDYPVERLYFGLNSKAGRKLLMRSYDLETEAIKLDDLDKEIVDHYFLKK